MIVKIHKADGGKMVLAVCDSELLGKKVEDGKKHLDLSSDFYNGEEMSDQDVCDLMRNAYILNLVGKKSVTLAVNEDLISGDYVSEIKGIPYAQGVISE